MHPSPSVRRSPAWVIPGGAVALAFAFGAYGCLLSPGTGGSNPSPTGNLAAPTPGSTTGPTPSPTPTGPSSPSPTLATVQMVTNSSGQPAFSPLNLTISKGTTVWFVNETSMPHTVTPFATGSWTSLNLSATVGASGSVVFNATGSFPYYCQYHLVESNMQATISVQ